MTLHKLALTLAAVALGTAACVGRAPIDEAPCPCPANQGYVCCENRCVLESQSTCGGGPSSAGAGGLNVTPDGGGPVAGSESGSAGAGGDGGGPGGAAGTNASPDGGDPVVASMDAGQVVVSPFVSVAISAAHVCAVRLNGDIECRGANDKGQATPPAGKKFYQVVAGANHTCGQEMYLQDRTKDRQWICWGDNTYGQATVPAQALGDVTAGDRHTCAIFPGETGMTCWGDNSLGQTTLPTLDPGETPGKIAAGRNHTCAAVYKPSPAANGTYTSRIVCWGDNSRGQSTPPNTILTPESLASAGDHSCVSGSATSDPFDAVCWGDNDDGQSTVPVGTIRELSLASGHSCATVDFTGPPVCWGTDWGTAKAMPPQMQFQQLFAGDYINCMTPLDVTKPMICWGQDYEPWY